MNDLNSLKLMIYEKESQGIITESERDSLLYTLKKKEFIDEATDAYLNGDISEFKYNCIINEFTIMDLAKPEFIFPALAIATAIIYGANKLFKYGLINQVFVDLIYGSYFSDLK